jgi:CelD/BcsL family acetyltransferase involved in cellulose biosynthesis
MRLIVHDTLSAFEQLQPEWNDLLQRSYSNRIFSTYEWQYTWWTTYEAGELWIVAVRDDNDRLLGLAPWFIEARPDERVVRSIGCVDVTDYVDLIIDVNHVEVVSTLLAAFLREHRDRYDRINLCNIHEDSPTLKVMPPLLETCGFTIETPLQEVCPVIHLPESWEQFLEGLDKKQRHELRRKLRRIEGEAQDLRWYMVDASHDLEAELGRFLELAAASQSAKAEFLSDRRNTSFIRNMARVMFECGWLQLSFLTIQGNACATYMNFNYRDGIQVYNSGLAPQQWGHLSPGIVLLCYTIQHAIEHKHTLFDFLRGNEEYKYRMGAVDTRIHMLKVS